MTHALNNDQKTLKPLNALPKRFEETELGRNFTIDFHPKPKHEELDGNEAGIWLSRKNYFKNT